MKLSISGVALDKAAAWAARIAPSPKGGATPILANVLLDANERGLEFRTTDYDTFGTVVAEAQIAEPGKTVVNAHLLASIAKAVRDSGQITLETGSRMQLRVKQYKASLPVVNVDDWPWPETGEAIGTIPAAALSRGLARVLPAASNDETLPELTGVEFDFAELLTLAACDRYRIGTIMLPWQPVIGATAHKLIIPSKLLGTMRDVIETDGGDVTLYSDGNTVTIATGRHRVTGRLIDKKYPKLQSLLEQRKTATTVTVSVVALGRAVKQVSAASEGPVDYLRLEFAENGIGVALADDPESASDIVEPGDFNFAGDPITIGVPCRYLRDALACVDAPMAQLRFEGSAVKPFLLSAAGEDGELLADGYQHLLMVVRLRQLVAA